MPVFFSINPYLHFPALIYFVSLFKAFYRIREITELMGDVVQSINTISSQYLNKYNSRVTIVSVETAPSSKDFTRFWSDSVTGISLMDTISSYFLQDNRHNNKFLQMFWCFQISCFLIWICRGHTYHFRLKGQEITFKILVSGLLESLSFNETVNQSGSSSFSRSINQPASQSVSQPINQPTNQPIDQ